MQHSVSSDTGYTRDSFTWLAYFLLAYFAYLQAALGPLMPFLRAELGLSYTIGGLHLSAFAVGMIVAGLTTNRLVRRWGRWRVFWGGAGGMAAGTFLLTAGRQVAVTLMGSLVMGTLGSLLLVMIQATLSDRHGSRRATALTESNVVAIIAAALAPLAVGELQRFGIGWRGALMLAVAGLFLLALRFGRVSLPDARFRSGDLSGNKEESLPAAFWAYWLVICLVVAVEWSILFWGADFLETVVGLARVNAVTTMSLFLGAMVLGRAIGSRLTADLPAENILQIALLITLAGFPLFWLGSLPWLSLTGLFFSGLGVANLFPLAMSAAVSAGADQANSASARVSLGAGLAVLSAPLALGGVADRVGIQQAFAITAVVLVAATLVAVIAGQLAEPSRVV